MTARSRGKSQRRDNIVAAARALMRESGDPGFSMRSLAREAGVSIATPYNLFGSKQAILLAVLDADLAEFERELAELNADKIAVLFEVGGLMSAVFAREPDFYRTLLGALARGGPELRRMAEGPRYLLWKRLLGQATEAGLLGSDVDPDAFAIASSQIAVPNVLEWAQGTLSLEEMTARNEYGLALILLAIATDRSRKHIEQRMRSAETKLQKHWRKSLKERLRNGDLDDETRAILADQLKHLAPDHKKEAPR